MRLIDSHMIKIPSSMIHNINGCCMIRAEDVQRIISGQPTAFDKEKVKQKIRNVPHGFYNVETENEIIGIVEKGGIE